jgi:hypothetical protein
MATPISICSNALMMLGASPINSFDEATSDNLDRARLCANMYPTVRDSILRSHPWNCATKRVVLAPLAEAPAHSWSAAFALPGDWLRTISINGSDLVDEFAMEGRRILCNANAIALRYVARVSESLFDATLVDVLEVAMAARLAYPITASASMKQTMDMELVRLMKTARAINGQEDTGDAFGDDGFLAARMGSTGWHVPMPNSFRATTAAPSPAPAPAPSTPGLLSLDGLALSLDSLELGLV